MSIHSGWGMQERALDLHLRMHVHCREMILLRIIPTLTPALHLSYSPSIRILLLSVSLTAGANAPLCIFDNEYPSSALPLPALANGQHSDRASIYDHAPHGGCLSLLIPASDPCMLKRSRAILLVISGKGAYGSRTAKV